MIFRSEGFASILVGLDRIVPFFFLGRFHVTEVSEVDDARLARVHTYVDIGQLPFGWFVNRFVPCDDACTTVAPEFDVAVIGLGVPSARTDVCEGAVAPCVFVVAGICDDDVLIKGDVVAVFRGLLNIFSVEVEKLVFNMIFNGFVKVFEDRLWCVNATLRLSDDLIVFISSLKDFA